MNLSERIHDDEPDTSEPVVRALLRAELPQWAHSKIEYLATSGTDNAMWRVRVDGGCDVVVRLPRRPGAAAGVLRDLILVGSSGTDATSATPYVAVFSIEIIMLVVAFVVLGPILRRRASPGTAPKGQTA